MHIKFPIQSCVHMKTSKAERSREMDFLSQLALLAYNTPKLI